MTKLERNPRNQDGIGPQELLVVSFGTSYWQSLTLTIGGIEDALEQAFPDFSIRRAFTSGMILRAIEKRDAISMDDVARALDRASSNGVKTLVIQPTHMMPGLEYHKLKTIVEGYGGAIQNAVLGKPLLSEEEDFTLLIRAITRSTAAYRDGKTALCFVGHGTEAQANAVYAKLQTMLHEAGLSDYYIGTVEASPTQEDVLQAVANHGGYERVVLAPLMIVAGDHANNDIAGQEEGSWKQVFSAAGYQVECLLQGLGQMEAVQQIFVGHAREAMTRLGG